MTRAGLRDITAVTTFIYALIDPRTKLWRYIGKSIKPHHRWRGHIAEAKMGVNRRRCRWILSLLRDGLEPELFIIEECNGDGSAQERHHIALARADGLDLTNLTDGGECFHHAAESIEKTRLKKLGSKHSAETRRKMSDARKGVPKTAEWRAKISAAHKGKRASDETRRKISLVKTGVKFSEAARRAMSLAQTGRRHSPETIEKIKRSRAAYFASKHGPNLFDLAR